MSRFRFVLVATSAVILLGVACTSGGGNPNPTSSSSSSASPLGSPVSGGSFVMSLPSDVPTMDPAHAGFDFASWSMTIAVNSALVDYDQGTKLHGDLAESYDVSSDGLTYTFNLRPNLSFSDGTPLTSADVQYSIERVLDPKTAAEGSYLFGGIVGASAFSGGKADHVSGIETPDSSTVIVKLTAPEPYFLYLLATPWVRVVQRAQVEKYGKDFSLHPLGSGPFMLKSWTPGQEIVLEKNPRYYDANHIYLNTVTVKLNQNDQTRILEFQRGDLSMSDIPAAAYPQIATNSKYEPYLVKNEDPDTYYIGMKTNQKPFDNATVRQALNYAVNKDRLVQLLNGRAIVSHGVIPPPMTGYDPNGQGYAYDPDKARALLKQAGYPNGFSTEIWTINDETSTRIVQSAANDLAAVGVKASIKAVDSSTFYSAVGDKNKVPMFFTFWWQDYPDAYDFFSNLLVKAAWGPTNATYFYDPVVDKDINQTAHSTDEQARIQLFRQAEEVVAKDAPWIFLYHTITVDVRQPNVYFYLHPIHIWRFADYWVKS